MDSAMSGGGRHEVVELVGGPLDGRRLRETDTVRFEHNPHALYAIDGHYYRPLRMKDERTLLMRYVGDVD